MILLGIIIQLIVFTLLAMVIALPLVGIGKRLRDSTYEP